MADNYLTKTYFKIPIDNNTFRTKVAKKNLVVTIALYCFIPVVCKLLIAMKLTSVLKGS